MNNLSLLYLSWYCLLSLRVSATLTPSQGPTIAPTGAPYMSNRGYAMSSTCNLNGEYMESWVDGRMIPKMDCDPTKLYTSSNRMSKCVYETLDYDNTTFFGVDGKWTYQDRHNKLNCDSIQIEDGPYDYDSLPVPYDPYVFCADKCINYTLSGDGVCNSVYIAQADDTYKIRCWLNDCVGPDMTSNTYASGYWATGNTKESGRSLWFHNMSQCYDQINFPPTNAPTHSPTLYPTFTPTNNPTLNPTSEPTLLPTNYPTLNPTSEPTLVPTNYPTLNPTSEPTLVPTNYPTLNPTSEPTLVPTNYPTINPTSEPTLVPTNYPTLNPTSEPTLVPTNYPTINPTSEPTLFPTNIPTLSPTNAPSMTRTIIQEDIIVTDSYHFSFDMQLNEVYSSTAQGVIQRGSDRQSSAYVRQPALFVKQGSTTLLLRVSTTSNSNQGCDSEFDLELGNLHHIDVEVIDGSNATLYIDGTESCVIVFGTTEHPIYVNAPFDVFAGGAESTFPAILGDVFNVDWYNITEEPTNSPTDSPTSNPTNSPTLTPTSTPTNFPTESPTLTPTSSPTESPTDSPTLTPTSNPTLNPTDFPTKSPTLTPTSSPTEFPTESPTLTPTSDPTDFPTESPTLTPTSNPTDFPTESPTLIPTSSPTDFPTKSPTLTPTSSPTEFPTESPTLIPTSSPTESPTLTPTLNPTEFPTDSPTLTPTSSPTESPTLTPTSNPTDFPTESPTLIPTSSPTDFPTKSPTLTPTSSPTEFPTESPTLIPTSSPTESPTLTPTLNPTDSPTDSPTLTPTSSPTESPTDSPTLTPTLNPTISPTNKPTIEPTISPTDMSTNTPTGTPTTLTPSSVPSYAPTGAPYMNNRGYAMSSTCAHNGDFMESWVDGRMIPEMDCDPLKLYSEQNQQTECTYETLDYDNTTFFGEDGKWTYQDRHNKWMCDSVEVADGPYAYSSLPLPYDPYVFCAEKCINYTHSGDGVCNSVYIAQADDTYALRCYMYDCVGPNMTSDNYTTGYWATGNTKESGRSIWFKDMSECSSAVDEYLLNTLSPTHSPTLLPTVDPTLSPTHSPTLLPTVDPTLSPTHSPTLLPTVDPTFSPTHSPTLSPTLYPSATPTNNPTYYPTPDPTNMPTLTPTLIPTYYPTEYPTITPSQTPTNNPTLNPTIVPTNAPTSFPTISPTYYPSNEPTMAPVPTISPTVYPTSAPFMSTRGYAMSSSCSHNGDFMESWVDGRMIPEMTCDSSNLYTDQNKQESCSFETLDYDNTTFFAEDGKWTYQNKHNRLNCGGVQVEDGPFPYNTLPTPYDPYVFCAERCINYTASGAGVCNSVYISQSEDTYAVRCWLNDCVGPTLTSDEYLTGYWATGNTKESCRSIWFNDMPQCSLEVQQYVESTQQPTLYPTPAPTQQPTEYPSVGPTSAPTNAPTLLPTLYPSNQPTTMVPTKAPVLTPSPTMMPTLAPFISNKGYTMSSSCNVNGEFYTSEVDAREIPKLECSSTALYTEEYKKRTCFYETLDYDNTEFFAEDGKWTYQNQHNKLLCDNTLTIYGPYSESDLPEPYDPYVFCADKCIDYNIKDNTGTCNSVLITLSDDSHLLRCYLYDCVGPDMMSNTYDTGTWATGNTKESCRSIWFGDMANCIYSVENPTGAPTMNPTQVPTSIAPTKSPITPSPRPTLTRVPSVGPTYSPQTPTTPSPSSPTTSAPTHYQPSATPEPTTPQTSSSLGSQQLILYGSIIGGSLFLIILVVIVAICIHTYRKSKAQKRLQRNIIISNPTIL